MEAFRKKISRDACHTQLICHKIFKFQRTALNPDTHTRYSEQSLFSIRGYIDAYFVRNIVNVANSGKTIVHFADLLQGEWIEQYIEAQKSIGRWEVDPDDKISFVRAETNECIESFCNTELSEASINTLTEALRSIERQSDEAQDETSSSAEVSSD